MPLHGKPPLTRTDVRPRIDSAACDRARSQGFPAGLRHAWGGRLDPAGPGMAWRMSTAVKHRDSRFVAVFDGYTSPFKPSRGAEKCTKPLNWPFGKRPPMSGARVRAKLFRTTDTRRKRPRLEDFSTWAQSWAMRGRTLSEGRETVNWPRRRFPLHCSHCICAPGTLDPGAFR